MWALAAAVGMLIVAAPAHAATRYATPAGSGTACTQAAPCGLEWAVDAAASGDEIVIGHGTYGSLAVPLEGDLGDAAGRFLTIRGEGTGALRPVIYIVDGVQLTQASSTVADVEVRGTGSGGAPITLAAGHAERVIGLDVGESIIGCSVLGSASIANSVCAGSSGASTYAGVGGTKFLRNVTIVGSEWGLYATGGVAALRNSLADGGSQADIAAQGSVNATNTAYTVVNPSANFTDNGGHVAAAPIYRDAPNNDYRQMAGSPLINAGSPAEVSGAYDLSGNLRTIGPAPDIGAYEYVPQPPELTGLDATPTTTGATITATLDTRGGATRYVLEYGAGYAQSTPPTQVFGAATPGTIAFELDGLTDLTNYPYRIRALSDGGAEEALGTFTTKALAPTASTGEATAVGQTSATLAGSADSQGAPGTARFTLTAGDTTIATPDQPLGATRGGQAVSADVSGLEPGTTYAYRVIVETDGGTATGPERTFTTAAVSAPPPPPAIQEPPPSLPTLSLNLQLKKGQSAGQLLLDRKTITLFVRCGNLACTATATGTVRAGKVILGRLAAPKAALVLGAGRFGSIKVISSRALRDKVRRYVSRHPRTKVTMVLQATFVASDGTRITRTETIRLRRLKRT